MGSQSTSAYGRRRSDHSAVFLGVAVAREPISQKEFLAEPSRFSFSTAQLRAPAACARSDPDQISPQPLSIMRVQRVVWQWGVLVYEFGVLLLGHRTTPGICKQVMYVHVCT